MRFLWRLRHSFPQVPYQPEGPWKNLWLWLKIKRSEGQTKPQVLVHPTSRSGNPCWTCRNFLSHGHFATSRAEVLGNGRLEVLHLHRAAGLDAEKVLRTEAEAAPWLKAFGVLGKKGAWRVEPRVSPKSPLYQNRKRRNSTVSPDCLGLGFCPFPNLASPLRILG